jgi:hypothetical protein
MKILRYGILLFMLLTVFPVSAGYCLYEDEDSRGYVGKHVPPDLDTNFHHLELRLDDDDPIPMGVFDMLDLEELFVGRARENYFITIPAEIGQLTNLRMLRINLIRGLPPEFANLQNLEELYMDWWG